MNVEQEIKIRKTTKKCIKSESAQHSKAVCPPKQVLKRGPKRLFHAKL